MKYIINSKNQVIATVDGNADIKDLKLRGERIIEQEENIFLEEAELKNGKVVRKIKSPKEIKLERELFEREQKIQEKIREIAERELKGEGKK